MSIFFPLETNDFFMRAMRAMWKSDWTDLHAFEYRLKLSFLLFKEIYIEHYPILLFGIDATDDERKRNQKAHDWLEDQREWASVSAEFRAASARLWEDNIEQFLPVLVRWTNQFGLLTDESRVGESAKCSDSLLKRLPIFRSRVEGVHFVSIGRDFARRQGIKAKERVSRIHLRYEHDYDGSRLATERSTRGLVAERSANELIDAWAAEALQLPIHYIARGDDSEKRDDDSNVMAIALDTLLEITAPNLEDVHLTTILELRDTKACSELRSMLSEFVNRIRGFQHAGETTALRQEIQKLWMEKLLNETLGRRKDGASLRVDLLTGAASLIPGAAEVLAGLEIAKEVRDYMQDRNSWRRIISELRKY